MGCAFISTLNIHWPKAQQTLIVMDTVQIISALPGKVLALATYQAL